MKVAINGGRASSKMRSSSSKPPSRFCLPRVYASVSGGNNHLRQWLLDQKSRPCLDVIALTGRESVGDKFAAWKKFHSDHLTAEHNL